MINNLDASAQRFLLDLTRLQRSIGRAEQQVSSGLKVNSAADAPDEVSGILQLRADLERNTQIKSNLDRLSTETATAEQALQACVQLVDRARVLAAQGAGSMQTAATRSILAGEVGGLLERLVAASRTMVDNRYVFSGDADQSPAYEINLGNPNGVDRLLAAAASRQVQHPSGTTFEAAKTAQDIFDSRNPDDTLAADNVFAAVNQLRAALENNNQAGIDSSLAALRAAGDHLNVGLGFYGTVQGKLTEADNFSDKLKIQLTSELSSRQDADLTAAILELQQDKLQEQAALTARAQLPRGSLFDLLK